QEPADKLVRCERHRFPAARTFDAIVLPAERHAAIISSDKPTVRDSNAMGVARQIAQHLLGSRERLLAVDYPLDPAQRRQEALEGLFVGEPSVGVEELQLAIGVRVHNHGEELASE